MSGAIEQIDGQTQIPDLLRDWPQTRAVLDHYGLRGCGGVNGPVETLDFFARAHDAPLSGLLQELRQAAAGPEPSFQPLSSSGDTSASISELAACPRKASVLGRRCFGPGGLAAMEPNTVGYSANTPG